MLKYVPFYFLDFFNDPRMLRLEPREQQQFLFILARMMLTGAEIPEDHKLIGRTLDISPNKAKQLVIKLKKEGFLVASQTGHRMLTLTSPRLSKEYEKARKLCDLQVTQAKERATRRWHPEG